MSKSQKVIIIGAGYGGMALANLLAKKGFDVHVYEKNPELGGRIHAVRRDGFLFDLGPSWYLMPEVFDQYYSLFGQSAQARLDLLRFTPGYSVHFEKYEPILIQGDVEKDVEVFERIEPGAGSRLRQYVAKSSRAYAIAVEHFLYNNFSSISSLKAMFRWPVLRHSFDMLGLTMRTLDGYVSSQFRDIRLKQLLEYHMVFLGSSPFQAPAIYTLMSHLDYRSGVYYPRRGMLSLIEDLRALGEELGVRYHSNSPVAQIQITDGKATGVVLEDNSVIAADIVVSNADLRHTETMLVPEEYRSFTEAYWSKRQPGPGAMLLSLGIRGSLPTLQHHNLYFVDNWRENFDSIYVDAKIPENASIYVCNPTKTDASLAPADHENIFVLMPLPAGVQLSATDTQVLTERCIEILARMTGEDDLAERIVSKHVFGPNDFGERFNAWELNAFGGESHLLSQSVIFRTPNHSKKISNLYYVGAGTLPGIGLPMCLIGAQLVYKKINGIRDEGPLTQEQL